MSERSMVAKRKSEEIEEGCENIDPNVPKKKRLSLSLKNKKGSRFGTISDEQLKSMTSYVTPKNSAMSSRWALKNLNDWMQEHNNQNPEKPCPEEILSPSCNKALLNEWLCVYIVETRSHSGERYPPKTIHALLCGILREMRVKNSEYSNFTSKDDPEFNKFQATLDNLFKQLRYDGVGADSSLTEGITSEDETKLWSSGVLNVETPIGLLNTVFYYCGKCFCLCGGQEHRNFTLTQLERKQKPDRYVYTEKSSKNKQGGVKQMRLGHKVVTVVANPKIGERCPVYILDKYISKLPEKAKETDLFYCKPCPSIPKNTTDPLFYASPIGKNTLGNMVRQMCQEANIDGKKTNHSL